jgi:hypothetical protein
MIRMLPVLLSIILLAGCMDIKPLKTVEIQASPSVIKEEKIVDKLEIQPPFKKPSLPLHRKDQNVNQDTDEGTILNNDNQIELDHQRDNVKQDTVMAEPTVTQLEETIIEDANIDEELTIIEETEREIVEPLEELGEVEKILEELESLTQELNTIEQNLDELEKLYTDIYQDIP